MEIIDDTNHSQSSLADTRSYRFFILALDHWKYEETGVFYMFYVKISVFLEIIPSEESLFLSAKAIFPSG